MVERTEKANNWIFAILVGKEKQRISYRGDFTELEIEKFQKCIENVEFSEGITQEYAEKLLRDNFFIGMRAYRHIRNNYGPRKQVEVCFKKSIILQIAIDYSKVGKLVIFIPVFDD